MFEKLFVKTSDLVFHTIAPYAVERERFLEHCGEEGFSKVALRRIAGIVVTAACDLHAHGGLDVDQERLEAAAGRIEMTRRQAGVRDDAREYRREFLRVTTRWVLFLRRLLRSQGFLGSKRLAVRTIPAHFRPCEHDLKSEL